jgi:hypothetical protein
MFEEKLIRQVKGGIFGIRQGTKCPKEVMSRLTLLKIYNPEMFEELFRQYTKAVGEK